MQVSSTVMKYLVANKNKVEYRIQQYAQLVNSTVYMFNVKSFLDVFAKKVFKAITSDAKHLKIIKIDLH